MQLQAYDAGCVILCSITLNPSMEHQLTNEHPRIYMWNYMIKPRFVLVFDNNKNSKPECILTLGYTTLM